MKLLSGDRPGHPVVTVALALLLVVLLAMPFIAPGTRPVALGGRIAVFVLLAASFDLLLGYTGIVSFAHGVFFGIGAYAAAIALAGSPGWGALALGTAAGVAVAVALAGLVALLSLRVRAIFFSMITLAVASFAQLLASQLRGVTGGEDGLTFSVPRALGPAFRLWPQPVLGVRLDGRFLGYELTILLALVMFLLLLRVVNSPFGRVLQAIRENAFRAEALGYRVVVYRVAAAMIGAAVAAFAGVLMAVQLRYTGPDATLSFDVMMDILLMVVIGGMGTLYGPALGAALVVVAEYQLQPGLQAASAAVAGLPVLPALLHPDRWLLWLGLAFVLIVRFFPAGLVGTLRARRPGPASRGGRTAS